jgi:glucose uptake protein GlcU
MLGLLNHGPPGSRLGLWYAILAAVFNGTFGMLSKLRSTRSEHPLVFNYWMSEGVALSGLFLLAVPPRVFSAWGVLSGCLFVLSASNAIAAISLIGLAAATGVWCGVAVLTSFAWGVLVAGDEVEHMWQAAAALALILAGIAGIAVSAANGGHQVDSPDVSREASNEPEALGSRAEGAGDAEAGTPLLARQSSNASRQDHSTYGSWQQELQPRTRVLLGMATAVAAGAVGGLILAPVLAAPKEVQGYQFLPSMALGVLIVSPALTSLLTCVPRHTFKFSQVIKSPAAGPGMAAGLVWNLGNLACILAVTDKHVGLAVAMPIMQCGLFVAGIWGIVLFREVQGARALALYWLSGGVLIAGAALLANAKED